MRVWIADIFTCLVFYIIYHHFYFKHCEQQRLKKMCESCIHKVSAEDIEQIRADAIDECIKTLAELEDTILSDRQYYTLMELKEQNNEQNN